MADISKFKVNGTAYDLKDAAVRARVTNIETTIASALVFKGTAANATAITGLTNYKKGWTYKASASFTITGVGTVENGDMIIAIDNYDSAYSALDWTIVQNNVDTMTGATSSAAGTRGLVPAPAASGSLRFLDSTGNWSSVDSLLSTGWTAL